MELGGAALTGLFIGMAWALVRVVEFFVKKYGKNVSEAVLIDEQAKKLDEIYSKCTSNKFGMLTSSQESRLENIEKMVEHLDELHSVYDENHVPKWYFPREMLLIVRAIHRDIDEMNDDLKEELGRIGAGQSISVGKISELINSQKLVTERLGDLITLWSKAVSRDN
jgi:hypothetical protein